MEIQPGQSMTHSGGFCKILTFNIHTTFRVEGEDQGYLLHIGGYTGTAGDAMSIGNGMKFATWDRDESNDCAVTHNGAWWWWNDAT